MIVSGINSLYLAAKRVAMRAKSITIVTYHSVSDTADRYSIGPDAFARQLEWISCLYKVIRLRDIKKAFSGSSIEERVVIITFDDAYCDFMEIAYPILKRLSIPCSVFVPSGFIGKYNEWDCHLAGYLKRPIMNSTQIVDLKKDGLVDFGSHSVGHKSMVELPIGEMKRQAIESADVLGGLVSSPITMFSYPYGHFSATTTKVLLESHYNVAVTTKWGTLNSDKGILRLKRITFRQEDTADSVRAKIEGQRDIYYAKGLARVFKMCM